MLEITFGQNEGDSIFGVFVYSYKTTIKWGAKQWTIDSNAGASTSDYEYCIWGGTADENVLLVWKFEDVESSLHVDFEMAATLDGNKLYIDYLAIDSDIYLDNDDFGPEYLVKK
jgi:hypothetical protein